MTRGSFALSQERVDGDASLIVLEGDLDLASAPTLKRALVGELGAGHDRLVVDLSDVTFIDSTAIGVLVGVKLQLSAGGILAIAGARPAVLKVFEVTGLDRTFDLFPTLDAALEHVRRIPSRHPDRGDESSQPPVESAELTADERSDAHAPDLGEAPGELTALSGDAAVILGIASTAMPFALTTRAQAEQWLRILRQHGEAAVALTSLGFTEDPVEGDSEHGRTDHAEQRGTDRVAAGPDTDVVSTVTRHARAIAQLRGASKVRTADVLGAVMEVYGEEFERALLDHGINVDDVVAQLDIATPGSGGRADPGAR